MTLLHLVGGFLGSGKTTAIIAACRCLMAQGQRVGVITNDQGKYLVDTAFVRLADVPAVEVSGGCFCCHYDDLQDHLDRLIDELRPHAIFAESVGSCADMVATVIKPLLSLRPDRLPPHSFSVFADARMLHRRLLGLSMPFNEDVVYIFDQQIHEAGVLVINKIDLLRPGQADEIVHLARARWPDRPILRQNSLDPDSVHCWLDCIGRPDMAAPHASLHLDYERYGQGEARLAWLDAQVIWTLPPGEGRSVITAMIVGIIEALKQQNLPIGHLKFIVRDSQHQAKISLTHPDDRWADQVPPLSDAVVSVLVNARVEAAPDVLRQVVQEAIKQTAADTAATFWATHIDSFQPGWPRPTHRME